MKKIYWIMLSAVMFFLTACGKESGSGNPETPTEEADVLHLVSYNMLFEYTEPEEPERRWASRCPNALKTFSKYSFDVIGTQELLTWQVRDLTEDGTFGRIGKDNRGTLADGVENETILYRKSRLTLLKQGQFWYSDTPAVAASMWGIHNRCCCWAQFRDRKNGKTFYVFNSHFHVNAPDQKWPNGLPFTNQQAEEIRLKSARLLLDVINGKVKIEGNDVNVAYGEPVFITGDLNCTDGDAPIDAILTDTRKKFQDARAMVSRPEGPKGTSHGFKTTTPTRRIDWIFVSGNAKASAYRVIDDQLKTQAWESDHLPVMFTFSFIAQ